MVPLSLAAEFERVGGTATGGEAWNGQLGSDMTQSDDAPRIGPIPNEQ
jgi:hypothetical protein